MSNAPNISGARFTLGPPPRVVRLKRSTRRNLFLALLISIAGVALSLFLLDRVQRLDELRARRAFDGEFAEGKITRKYSRRDEERRAGAIVIETSYHVDYEFPAGGRTVRGIGRIRKALWDQLQEGGAVGVYYHPDNPSMHELAMPNEARNRRLGRITLYCSAAFVMIFLLATIDYLNRIRREQRQLRDWAVTGDGKALIHPANRADTILLEKITLVEPAG